MNLKYRNYVKFERLLVFSWQTWILCARLCVCVWECFHWIFNQGVTLSVPIGYSRQGSPASCFWTTTPSKKQIMLPQSNAPRKWTTLLLSFSLSPVHQPSKSDRCWEKMKLPNKRKVKAASGIRCVLSCEKGKQDYLMWGATNMIQCCVLWAPRCHKPFSKIIRCKGKHTLTHTNAHKIQNKPQNNVGNCDRCARS